MAGGAGIHAPGVDPPPADDERKADDDPAEGAGRNEGGDIDGAGNGAPNAWGLQLPLPSVPSTLTY